jgi:putative GTP pyrophosphokinase
MNPMENNEFDFELHKINAMEEYSKIRPLYEVYCNILKTILTKCIEQKKIKYHSIEARPKEIDKFGEKASQPSEESANEPKYKKPLSEITDMAGARIITFFPVTIDELDKVIYDEFNVIEKNDKIDLLEREEKFGYQSVHYLVKLNEERKKLSEYRSCNGLIAEIQVRTILQHAWAEIEHDIEYKTSITIPKTIKRRFLALAGMLEIADREFQSIQNENEELKAQSRKLVKSGKLDEIEITGDSLKAYLDKKYGIDGRMKKFSYEFMASNLIKIGFRNIRQIDDCIKDYDDDNISRIIWTTRRGQLTRFESVITAGLGEEIIKRHPWCTSPYQNSSFWVTAFTKDIERLRNAGIEIGKFKFNAT